MKLNEEEIKYSLEPLDDRFPDFEWTEEQLWDKVEAKLNKPKKAAFNYVWYGVAASLILGFVLVNHFLNAPEVSESITFAVSSEVEVSYNIEETNELDIQTLAFINENCLKDLQVCNTSEFKELKNQLDETTLEIDNLNNMIAQYGDSPELVKSKIKIENFRSEVMRQLVQIITS